MLISHGPPPPKKKKIHFFFFFFFFFCLSEVCDVHVRRVPLLFLCLQNRGKNFEVGKKKKKCRSHPPPPPPRSSAYLGLARLYNWQRTALVFLTPNPHPMLAALIKIYMYLEKRYWMLGERMGIPLFHVSFFSQVSMCIKGNFKSTSTHMWDKLWSYVCMFIHTMGNFTQVCL